MQSWAGVPREAIHAAFIAARRAKAGLGTAEPPSASPAFTWGPAHFTS